MTTLTNRYRHKPIEIEAYQWREAMGQTRGVYQGGESGKYFVTNRHRERIYLEEGDWIVCEPDGLHYRVIKPNVLGIFYDRSTNRPSDTNPFVMEDRKALTGSALGRAFDPIRPPEDEPIIIDDKEDFNGVEAVQESVPSPAGEDEG